MTTPRTATLSLRAHAPSGDTYIFRIQTDEDGHATLVAAYGPLSYRDWQADAGEPRPDWAGWAGDVLDNQHPEDLELTAEWASDQTWHVIVSQ